MDPSPTDPRHVVVTLGIVLSLCIGNQRPAVGQGLLKHPESTNAPGGEKSAAAPQPTASLRTTTRTDSPWSIVGSGADDACPMCGNTNPRWTGLSPLFSSKVSFLGASGSGFSIGALGARASRVSALSFTPVGSTTPAPMPLFLTDPLAGFGQWGLTVSGARMLMGRPSDTSLSLVGDLFVPLNGKRSPLGTSSGTVRAGVKLGF